MKFTKSIFKVKSISIRMPSETSSGYGFTLQADNDDVEPANGVACSVYVPESGALKIEHDDHKITIKEVIVTAKADDVNGKILLACKPTQSLSRDDVVALAALIGEEVSVTFTPAQMAIFNEEDAA